MKMAEFRTPIKKKTKDLETNETIIIPPSPFLKHLGYGTGVSVMQLVRSPRAGQIRSPWALKMINKKTKPSSVYSERIKAEAELLQRMSHPNIVGFRAFSGAKILYLGMEACDISLGDMIEKKVEANHEPFSPKQMLKVALDISSALHYIHTKIHILHGDIKSYNILVNGDFAVCKLCDFGCTLPLNENGEFDRENNKGVMYYGTEPWCAPEVMLGDTISDKTDMWSFGLTLWEMVALTPPHAPPLDDSAAEPRDLDDSAASDLYYSDHFGTRPEIPDDISVEEYKGPLALFCRCTESDPDLRPSADLLHKVAQHLINDDENN